MRNKVQDGRVITYTNSGAPIKSGDPVLINDRYGIASVDIDTDQSGSVRLFGVYLLDAVDDTAFDQGDLLYWDAAEENLTKESSGNVCIGLAFKAKDETATMARVALERVSAGGGGGGLTETREFVTFNSDGSYLLLTKIGNLVHMQLYSGSAAGGGAGDPLSFDDIIPTDFRPQSGEDVRFFIPINTGDDMGSLAHGKITNQGHLQFFKWTTGDFVYDQIADDVAFSWVTSTATWTVFDPFA